MGTLRLDKIASFLLDTMGALTWEDIPTLTAEGTESSNKSDTMRCGASSLERETLGVRLKVTLSPALLDRLRRPGEDRPYEVAECLQLGSLEPACTLSQATHHLPDVVDSELLVRLT